MNLTKTIYTIYAKEDDMTFIMEEDEKTLSVVGFYFGEPDDKATEMFAGKQTAIIGG